VRQAGARDERLAEPDRRAAADGDDRVGPGRISERQRLVGHRDRRVHDGTVEARDRPLPQRRAELVGRRTGRTGRDDQHPLGAEPGQLLRYGVPGTGPEQHPGRRGLVDDHHDPTVSAMMPP
jgi:hypothetical protein